MKTRSGQSETKKSASSLQPRDLQTTDKRVSVVMAAHNEESFIKISVDSILNQTWADFEFIIMNDGSTDRTQTILGKYQDPRIRLIQNQETQGLTRSLIAGIRIASGEYIARMDADDRSHPERLEKQLAYLQEHPDVILLGCNHDLIDQQGRWLGKAIPSPETDDEIKQKLPEFNCFAHGTVIFRKDVYDRVGGYRECFKDSQDYDLWLRMVGTGKLANYQESLYDQRVHPSMKSVKYLDRQHRFHVLAQELYRIREQDGDDDAFYRERTAEIMEEHQKGGIPGRQRRAKSTHLLRLGLRYLGQGYVRLGLEYTLRAFLLSPFNPALLHEFRRRRLFSRR